MRRLGVTVRFCADRRAFSVKLITAVFTGNPDSPSPALEFPAACAMRLSETVTRSPPMHRSRTAALRAALASGRSTSDRSALEWRTCCAFIVCGAGPSCLRAVTHPIELGPLIGSDGIKDRDRAVDGRSIADVRQHSPVGRRQLAGVLH